MNTLKTYKFLSIVSILFATVVANANGATKTFEAIPSTVRIPASVTGTISLRECEECQFESIRVTAKTLYRINNKFMQLNQFRLAVQQLKLERQFTINVRRDEESRTVAIVFIVAG
jgi:predicted  nucleic acid-binding Zn-ribbon protein